MTNKLQELYDLFLTKYCKYNGFIYPKTLNHIDDKVINEFSFLIILCCYGIYDLVKKCIEFGADVNKRTGEDGTCAVQIALVNTHFKVAELLLQNGANPNIKLSGRPLFYYHLFSIESLKLLLKYGAMLNENYKWISYSVRKSEIKTFIQQKIAHRKWVILRVLVKFLAVHQRAVITANHPKRLEQLGTFELTD